MDIELIGEKDVKGRGKSKGRERYSKYREALEPHVEYFKNEIEKSKDGKVRVKNNEILKIVGKGVGKSSTSIYWATKFVLFDDGLFVSQGTHRDGSDILVIRTATEDDVLPVSMIETGTITKIS